MGVASEWWAQIEVGRRREDWGGELKGSVCGSAKYT